MAKLPVKSAEWPLGAPVRVEESVEIAAPPEAVWALIADHETWPEWFDALDEVVRVGDGVGVGSGRRVTAKRINLTEEFTAWDENERFAFSVVEMPVPLLAALAEEVRIAASPGGCTVTYRQGLEGRRGLGWLAGLAARDLRRQLRKALDNLKATAER